MTHTTKSFSLRKQARKKFPLRNGQHSIFNAMCMNLRTITRVAKETLASNAQTNTTAHL